MPDVIEALPAIWTWTWHTSLHLCVLICLIRIVQLLFQKFLTPRWHYALWMLVLVRMVMPIGVETPWSVFNLFKTETVVEGEAVAALPAYDFLFESMTQPILINTIERTEFTLVHGLAMAWLMGIALLSIHLFRQWMRLREVVAAGTEIRTAELLATLHTCGKSLKIRHGITVVECAIPVPGLYGFLRPKILMPQGLCDSLTADELRFILLHELAHYKRLDLPVNWLMTLMQVMHWFNPLVWYGFFRMRTDRELACDALALSHANDDDPEAYGKTLLKLMNENHGIRPIPGMIGILENHAHLKRRIVAIARFTTNSYRWSIPALLILALVGGVTLTQAVQDTERTESIESTPRDASILNEDEIELVWVHLDDGTTGAFFRKVSSIEIEDRDAQELRLKGFDGLTKDPNVLSQME